MLDVPDHLDKSSLRAETKTFLDDKAQMRTASSVSLWAWLGSGAQPAVQGVDWHLQAGTSLFFRGQADSAHGLTSSLYRECIKHNDASLTEYQIAAAEMALIAQMRTEGIGRKMSDGQLLMVLQHHGIPTRLIDVSVDPFVALFFAVEKHESTDGRLFVVHPHSPEVKLQPAGSTPSESHPLPWASMAKGRTRSYGDWAAQVAPVLHKSMDPRMHAQEGRFLVGGLSRIFGGQKTYGNVPNRHRVDVSNLNLNFIHNRAPHANLCWGGTAWTVVIKAEWKMDLLERLRKEKGIAVDTMYPPLAEVARLARFRIEQAMDGRAE